MLQIQNIRYTDIRTTLGADAAPGGLMTIRGWRAAA
jgi:hypothetical protein